VWMVDAGANIIDRDTCRIQQWTKPVTGTGLSGPDASWTFKKAIVVDTKVPCYSMAGRQEGAELYLYLTTVDGGSRRAASSKLYRIASTAGTITVVATAPANTQFRGVSIPPIQRANYTCPAGSFGTTNDLTVGDADTHALLSRSLHSLTPHLCSVPTAAAAPARPAARPAHTRSAPAPRRRTTSAYSLRTMTRSRY
jgi:hypothetical protein